MPVVVAVGSYTNEAVGSCSELPPEERLSAEAMLGGDPCGMEEEEPSIDLAELEPRYRRFDEEEEEEAEEAASAAAETSFCELRVGRFAPLDGTDPDKVAAPFTSEPQVGPALASCGAPTAPVVALDPAIAAAAAALTPETPSRNAVSPAVPLPTPDETMVELGTFACASAPVACEAGAESPWPAPLCAPDALGSIVEAVAA